MSGLKALTLVCCITRWTFNPKEGCGSPVVKVSACHKFEPSTTKDPSCMGEMHVKSVEISNDLTLSCPSEEVYTVRRVPTQRMEGAAATPATPSGEASAVQSRSASGASATSAAARSLSMNSVSSEGSAESHVVEQEDIIVLTHDVRSFKEALGKLRRIFHPERDKTETMRVAAHERLGEVLRILRSILEKYPPIQSTELLMTAGTLIQQVKGYNYEDEKSDPSNFFDAIDQLALAFSSRTATADSDVAQSERPIFDDFFQHLWPYIGNNTANVVFQMVKRLWLIRIDQ
ncbi:rho GTPase-activating protein 45 [Trichonephila clavipes]|nr:rho GTPase-activating protein 45 [Trichonephila clavipes]